MAQKYIPPVFTDPIKPVVTPVITNPFTPAITPAVKQFSVYIPNLYPQWKRDAWARARLAEKPETPDIIRNYKDPKILNSIADALFNREAKKEVLGDWANIPVLGDLLSVIPATAHVAYENVVKPISHGNWKAAGINALMDFSETLDIVANPVKGRLGQGWHEVYKDLKQGDDILTALGKGFRRSNEATLDAIGLGKNGRINYDVNTGNGLLDFAGEMVADPLNWMTLGGKGLISAGAKGTLRSVLKNAVKESGEDIVKEMGARIVKQDAMRAAKEAAELQGKQLTEAYIEKYTRRVLALHSDDALRALGADAYSDLIDKASSKAIKSFLNTTAAKDVTKNFLGNTVKKQIFYNNFYEALEDSIVNMSKAKGFFRPVDYVPESFIKAVQSAKNQITDTMTMTNLKAVQKMVKTTETVDSTLFKAATISTGLYPSAKLIKEGSGLLGQYIDSRRLKKLEGYQRPGFGTVSITDFDKIQEAAQDTTSDLNRALKATKSGQLPDENIVPLFKEGFAQDDAVMYNILRKNDKDPKKAHDEIMAYMQEKHGITDINEYKAQLDYVNAKLGGAFEDYAVAYEKKIKHLQQLKEDGIAEATIKKVAQQRKVVSDLRKQLLDEQFMLIEHNPYSQQVVENFAKQNLVPEGADRELVQKALADEMLNSPSFITSFPAALKEMQKDTEIVPHGKVVAYTEQFLTQYMNNHIKGVIDKANDVFHTAAKVDDASVNELLENFSLDDFVQEFKDSIMKIVDNKLISDATQIDPVPALTRVRSDIAQWLDMYDEALGKLDKSLKAQRRISHTADTNKVFKIREGSENIFEHSATHADPQGIIVQRLKDKAMTSTSPDVNDNPPLFTREKDYRLNPVATEQQLQDIKGKLADIFDDEDLEQGALAWAETLNKTLFEGRDQAGISPQLFAELVHRFNNATLDDLHELEDVHRSLQQVFNRAQQRADELGKLEEAAKARAPKGAVATATHKAATLTEQIDQALSYMKTVSIKEAHEKHGKTAIKRIENARTEASQSIQALQERTALLKARLLTTVNPEEKQLLTNRLTNLQMQYDAAKADFAEKYAKKQSPQATAVSYTEQQLKKLRGQHLELTKKLNDLTVNEAEYREAEEHLKQSIQVQRKAIKTNERERLEQYRKYVATKEQIHLEAIADLDRRIEAGKANLVKWTPRIGYFDRQLDVVQSVLKSIEKDIQDVINPIRNNSNFNEIMSKATGGQASKGISVLSEDLKEIADLMQAFDPVQVQAKTLKVMAGDTYQQFKVELTHASMKLLNNKQIADTVSGILDKQAEFKLLHTLSALGDGDNVTEHWIQAAALSKEVIKRAQIFRKTGEFMTKIANATGLADNIKLALQSTIQRYGNRSASRFLERIDGYSSMINQNIEGYLYSINMHDSISLERFAEKYDIEQQHRAAADVALLMRVMKEELPEHFNDPNVRVLVADLETTSLLKEQGQIVEASILKYSPDLDYSGKIDDIIQTQLDASGPLRGLGLQAKFAPGSGLDPSPEYLNKLFPDKPYKEQLAEFYSRYSTGRSEQDMLRVLLNRIQSEYVDLIGKLDPSFIQKGRVKLVIHNGDRFDIPFLKQRIAQYPELDGRILDYVDIVDTTKLLKAKAGYTILSDSDKLIIRNLIQDYAEELEQIGADKLIEPGSRHFAKTLDDLVKTMMSLDDAKGVQRSQRLSALMDGTMGNGVQALTGLEQTLRDTAQAINKELSEITTSNRALSHFAFKKAWVNSEDGKDFFINEVCKDLGYTPEEAIAIFGDYLNTSKMLYRTTQGLNTYGYRNVVEMDKIMSWFTYKQGDELPYIEALRFTRAAKQLDTKIDMIKNVVPLVNSAAEIKQSLDIILKRINETTGHKAYPVLSRLNLERTDVLAHWAMLTYAVRKADDMNLEDTIGQMPASVQHLLKNQDAVYNRAISESELDYFAKKANPEISEAMSNTAVMEHIIDQFQNDFLKVSDIGDAVERGEQLTRSRKQAIAHAMHHPYSLLLSLKRVAETMIGDTPEAQKAFRQNQLEWTDKLAVQQLYTVLQQQPEQLRDFLARDALGWIEFNLTDDNLKAFVKDMGTNQQAYLDYNIALHYDQATNRTYVYLTKDTDFHVHTNNELKKVEMRIGDKLLDETLNKEILFEDDDFVKVFGYGHTPDVKESFLKSRETMAELSRGRSLGTLGDTLSAEGYEKLYSMLPEAVRANMIPVEKIHAEPMFKGMRYNWTNLGTISSRRAKQAATPTSIMDYTLNGASFTGRYAQAVEHYVNLYYDNGLDINHGWLATASLESIQQALEQAPEYMFSALVKDKHNGYIAVSVPIRNASDLANARRLNAVLMPIHTFSKVVETVNNHQFNSKALRIWHKIIYTYKVGYLLDPGVFLRNYIDSTMKNAVSTDSSVFQVAQYQIRAASLIQKYNTCVTEILKMGNNRWDKGNFENYFKKMRTPLDLDTYRLINAYVLDGPSAGMTSSWEKFFKTVKNPDEVENAWTKFTHISNMVMMPNQWIEQTNRLAAYILFLEKGMNTTQAFYNISKTHFDYMLKSDTEKLVELVFPFYTFTMRNLEYWMDAALEHPWMPIMYRDMMTPVWDFDGLDEEQLEKNQSLQYRILSGAIPLYNHQIKRILTEDKHVVTKDGREVTIPKGTETTENNTFNLKAGFSFMDAINILMNPVGAVEDRMWAPLKMALMEPLMKGLNVGGDQSAFQRIMTGALEPQSEDAFGAMKGVIPIFGTAMQRYLEMGPKYFSRTENILNIALPGVFGATQTYGDSIYPEKEGGLEALPKAKKQWQTFPHYSKRSRSKGYKRFPKRAKKVYAKKAYAKKAKKLYVRKTFPKKTYTSKKAWFNFKSYYPQRIQFKSYIRQHYPKNFYSDVYSKTGKTRLKTAMLPATGYNLKYKIKNSWGFIRR